MRCKIIDIVHSGRKDIRYEPVGDPKYYGLINSIIEMPELEEIEAFKGIIFGLIETKSKWLSWSTSEIIRLAIGFDNLIYLETVNTIYIFEKVE